MRSFDTFNDTKKPVQKKLRQTKDICPSQMRCGNVNNLTDRGNNNKMLIYAL